MADLKYWAYTIVALAVLIWPMALLVRAAKKDRRFAGLMFATTILFGAKTMQPPPRHETEDEDTEKKGQKQGDRPKAGQP